MPALVILIIQELKAQNHRQHNLIFEKNYHHLFALELLVKVLKGASPQKQTQMWKCVVIRNRKSNKLGRQLPAVPICIVPTIM